MFSNKPIFPIDTATACQYKWNWSTLFLNSGITRSCHRASESVLTVENFNNFHNTSEKIDARKKMLVGQWPDNTQTELSQNSCGYCKNIENLGGFSDRMYSNTLTNFLPPEFKQDKASLVVSPTILEIYFNNTCNLACNYCWAELSSKIEIEDKKFGYFEKEDVKINSITPRKNYQEFVKLFWVWMEKHSSSLRRLNVLGGEPFYQKDFDDLLSFFDKHPNKFCEVSAITNLVISSEKLENYLDKIKKLIRDKKIKRFDITCSIDCWGPQQEYVRLGLDLNNWIKNFEFLLKQKWLYINTNSTITPLTIKTMPDLIENINNWKKIHKISQQVGGVLGPKYWKPEIFGNGFFTADFEKIMKLMPEDNEQEINVKKYMSGIINSVEKSKKDDVNIKNFLIWIKEKDRRRNTNYRKVFSWLEQFDVE